MMKERDLDFTLCKELASAIDVHKCTVILLGLTMFYDKIYNSYLLADYRDMEGSPKEKAEIITNLLFENIELFNKVYNLCWELVKERVK